MGETQENGVTHHNVGQSPPLKYYLQLKTKENVGDGVWDLEGEESNSHGVSKANVW